MITSRRTFFTACRLIFFPNFSFGENITTPRQSEGPFYPKIIPEDNDNNLVKNGKNQMESGGNILNLFGLVINPNSNPLEGLTVEIWQTDKNGVYRHSGSIRWKNRDNQFQGFGRTISDMNGKFYFRTIIPVEYPGRTPHIHLKIWNRNKNILTTQFYIHGHPLNIDDFIFNKMTREEKKLNSMKIIKMSSEFKTNITLVV